MGTMETSDVLRAISRTHLAIIMACAAFLLIRPPSHELVQVQRDIAKFERVLSLFYPEIRALTAAENFNPEFFVRYMTVESVVSTPAKDESRKIDPRLVGIWRKTWNASASELYRADSLKQIFVQQMQLHGFVQDTITFYRNPYERTLYRPPISGEDDPSIWNLLYPNDVRDGFPFVHSAPMHGGEDYIDIKQVWAEATSDLVLPVLAFPSVDLVSDYAQHARQQVLATRGLPQDSPIKIYYELDLPWGHPHIVISPGGASVPLDKRLVGEIWFDNPYRLYAESVLGEPVPRLSFEHAFPALDSYWSKRLNVNYSGCKRNLALDLEYRQPDVRYLGLEIPKTIALLGTPVVLLGLLMVLWLHVKYAAAITDPSRHGRARSLCPCSSILFYDSPEAGTLAILTVLVLPLGTVIYLWAAAVRGDPFGISIATRAMPYIAGPSSVGIAYVAVRSLLGIFRLHRVFETCSRKAARDSSHNQATEPQEDTRGDEHC